MNQDTSKFRYVFTIFDDFTEEYKLKHKASSLERYLTIELMEKFLQENGKEWSFQQEHTQAKRLHYQGRVSLFKKVTKRVLLSNIKTWFMANTCVPVVMATHWMTLVTISPEMNQARSFLYTKKDESRVPGTFRSYPPIYDGRDIELMINAPRFAWQLSLDNLVVRESAGGVGADRHVVVIHDPLGGAGKTKWIKKQLFFNPFALYVPIENTLERTMAALTSQPAKQLYLIDVPRGNRSKQSWFDIFKLCENLKNGILTSSFGGKYSINLYNTATVILMTNMDIYKDGEMYSQLSVDRWILCTLKRYPFDDRIDLTTSFELDYTMDSRPYPGIG